jgi:hypothetical protein
MPRCGICKSGIKQGLSGQCKFILKNKQKASEMTSGNFIKKKSKGTAQAQGTWDLHFFMMFHLLQLVISPQPGKVKKI